MYEYYDDSEEYMYRPDGPNPPGPGGMPFGQQPPFGGPPFGGPPFGQQPPFGGAPFGGPPFGGPPFGQQQPFGGGPGYGPPSGPPPAISPNKPIQGFGGVSAYAVSPITIRPCLFRYVYIWLDNGDNFWAWLIFVSRRSVAGWRWRRNRWVYFGLDVDRIDNFICF